MHIVISINLRTESTSSLSRIAFSTLLNTDVTVIFFKMFQGPKKFSYPIKLGSSASCFTVFQSHWVLSSWHGISSGWYLTKALSSSMIFWHERRKKKKYLYIYSWSCEWQGQWKEYEVLLWREFVFEKARIPVDKVLRLESWKNLEGWEFMSYSLWTKGGRQHWTVSIHWD